MGGEVRKVKWIGRSGAPDRVVMLPERYVDSYYIAESTSWVELKAPGKRATPAQRREHERMGAMGQYVFVIDSFKDVDALLA